MSKTEEINIYSQTKTKRVFVGKLGREGKKYFFEYDKNYKKLKNKIEVRHAFQPLRAIIVDEKVARLKEIKNPGDYERKGEEKTFIFYTIYDPVWVKWLRTVFHSYFDLGDYAEARIRELKSIQKIR